ncbi:hypothetical protein EAE96_002420 [Botrytis aclada]|nr:hypothetical protein EAE96_002420 [Botrytis aclada]
MVRPSRIARKARREHERQQGISQKRIEAEGARQLSRDCGTDRQTSPDTHAVGCGQSTIGSLVAPKPIRGMRIGSLRRKTKRDLKNKLFKGVVVIEPRETALSSAAKEVDSYFNEDRLVLWTDGSLSESSGCGIGIAYRSPKYGWDDIFWRIRGQISINHLEIYAVPSKVVIYSDSCSALELFHRWRNSLAKLEKLPYAEQLIVPGIIASEALSVLGVEVELRYVPAHSGVEGNVKADRAAKIGRNNSIGKGKLTVARVVGSRA